MYLKKLKWVASCKCWSNQIVQNVVKINGRCSKQKKNYPKWKRKRERVGDASSRKVELYRKLSSYLWFACTTTLELWSSFFLSFLFLTWKVEMWSIHEWQFLNRQNKLQTIRHETKRRGRERKEVEGEEVEVLCSNGMLTTEENREVDERMFR